MSTTAANVGESRSTINFLFVLLVVVLVAVLGNFLWLGLKNVDDRIYLQNTSEIQIMSQQMVKYAREAARGNYEAFNELRAIKKKLQEDVDNVTKGNEALGLPPPPAAVAEEVHELEQTWKPMAEAAELILSKETVISELAETIQRFSQNMAVLQTRADQMNQMLTRKRVPAQTVYISSQQLVLANRMLKEVADIQAGGPEAVSAADAFGRDAAAFGRILTALLDGDKELGVKAITDQETLKLLGGVYNAFEEISQDVEGILQSATQVFDVTEAAENIFLDSESLRLNAEQLASAYTAYTEKRLLPSVLSGLAIAAIAALLILIIAWMFYREQVQRRRVTEQLNQRNQEAILRLLDEMGSLAEGDLTVNATVTEDITGAIADSVNFAVEALRSLVTTINETAELVATSAQEAQATATHLAEASEHQAQQITAASAAVNEIAVSIDEVSKNAAESADVAQRSVAIAHKGAEVVRQSIEGMDDIREQIQETSKRIKRLGESSQEIGDIVELINDIAEQTNILALNAAIQASSAGEAGRGFAVVADEVQRLAERSTNATKRIETLVKTIQADTFEAVKSMEETTAEVVSGAHLAENAGEALNEIEKVSNDLADLIQNIYEAARQQSAAATNISGTMNVIQEITTQTSAGTEQTAESIGRLAELATELRKSVAGFKLPG